MNALELHGVQKTYPDFTLGPIDLTLPGGTVCGLIGENGAGKSTTLKLILGILPPESGTIRVLGKDDLEASPCTRAGSYSARTRTPCGKNTPSGTALPGNWRSWIKTPSSAIG